MRLAPSANKQNRAIRAVERNRTVPESALTGRVKPRNLRTDTWQGPTLRSLASEANSTAPHSRPHFPAMPCGRSGSGMRGRNSSYLGEVQGRPHMQNMGRQPDRLACLRDKLISSR